MSVWWPFVPILLIACGGDKSEPAPGVEKEDTAEAVVEDTNGQRSPEGLTLSFVETHDEWQVDECSTTCISARLTQEGEPVEGASVDLWVEHTAVGLDLLSSSEGVAESCISALPVGDWRAVAVAEWEGERIEAETPISVLPFGFEHGIERNSVEGLPYTPTFIRSEHNPLLMPGPAGSFDSVGVLFPSVAKTDDGWVMWYSGTSAEDYSVGTAASEDGIHWWRRSSPTLPPLDEEGSWKRYATNAPMVVADGEGWRVYYSGRAEDSRDISIGMAIGSTADSVTNFGDNPVFEWAESEVSWAGQAVAHPAILRHPNGHWEMWYSTGLHKLGYAYSTDGVAWNRWCRNPLLEGATGDSWESHQVKAADVILHDGWYLMAYTGGVRGSFRIGWAMSRDGLHWTRAEDPVLRPALEPGTWESSAVTGPSLMVDGDSLLMWYGGSGMTGSSIGLATASIPSTFGDAP